MSEHIGTGNLSMSGREKPRVGRNARPASDEFETARPKSSKQVDEEVTGESIRIGVVRPKLNGRSAASKGSQKAEALKLRSTLTAPIARTMRPVNADGATSFHFFHEAIAKTRNEKITARGTTNRKGAAKSHAQYLERASAVATGRDPSGTSLELAIGEDPPAAVGMAAAGGTYIEREEALAHREDGIPVIYSNISKDANERKQFWTLVEKHEVEPNPDYLRITTSQDPVFWQTVKADPRCPDVLAIAIADAVPTTPYRVPTDDNEVVREIMTDHGWKPPSPRKPKETEDEKLAREKLDLQNAKGAVCVDGRGGHIQNRIVGELPHEVSQERRERILRRFADYFEAKNLPYVAVMHAPDHTNNVKNWHFHLAYYERPCRRFSEIAKEHLPDEPKHNDRARAIYDRKEKALASGELNNYVGQWDFTVPVTHKTKCGHRRTTFPFFQDKDRECNHHSFPLKLRKMLAEFTNDELQAAGQLRRVDPRRYEEMGINKQAEEHLGSNSSQLEILGIPTPRGVGNEAKQWQWILEGIERRLQTDNKTVDNQSRLWRQSLGIGELTLAAKDELHRLIDTWASAKAGPTSSERSVRNSRSSIIEPSPERNVLSKPLTSISTQLIKARPPTAKVRTETVTQST